MFRLSTRSVVKVIGNDAASFLHNVTTNDVMAMESPSAIYNCILNSRGRFLYDFFLIKLDDHFLLDCLSTERDDLVAFLRLYRVHLKVKVLKVERYIVTVDTAQHVRADACATLGADGVISFPDVRCQALGMRYMIPVTSTVNKEITEEQDPQLYDEIRIRNTVPTLEDMVKGESFPLHYGLDRLRAICHKKGCYIGQETVARMHIVGAKKLLRTVMTAEPSPWPPYGTEVFAEDLVVGKLLTTAGAYGLTMLDITKLPDEHSQLKVGDVSVIVHNE